MTYEVVVVNERDKVIGSKSRDEAHRDGTPHRIAVVYVTNSEGQILVQVRMSGRLDHSSAGHVDVGEEYLDTARRELAEELGMHDVELTSVGHGVSEESIEAEGTHRVHVMRIYTCQGEPGELAPDEVRGVFWADPYDVLVEMKDDPDSTKYIGGFKTSLPIFLEARM